MGTPIRKGGTALIEQPNSPKWVFGEQVSVVRNFISTDYAVAIAAAPMRGSIGTGVVSGYRVRESQVERVRGGMGALTIGYENFPGTVPGQGAQLPNDEAEISGDEIERALQRHPRYKLLDKQTLANINTLLNTSLDDAANTAAFVEIAGDALAVELYEKLQREFTHYPTPSPIYRLVTYTWTPPLNLSPGGFRETPPNTPIVPPTGLDWLRKPDRMSYNGTYWVIEKRWLGYIELDDQVYP